MANRKLDQAYHCRDCCNVNERWQIAATRLSEKLKASKDPVLDVDQVFSVESATVGIGKIVQI